MSKMSKIALVLIAIAAIWTGLAVVDQAGLFWSLVAAALVAFFGLLALMGLIDRSLEG